MYGKYVRMTHMPVDNDKSFEFQFPRKEIFYAFYSYYPESSPEIIDNN